MSPDLQDAVRFVVALARAEFGDVAHGTPAERHETAQRWAAFAKMRIIDRWYRFAAFGVETRAQLANVSVSARWVSRKPADGWEHGGDVWGLDTEVSFTGTCLEGR